jgi:type II secretory pathway component PulF
MASTLQNVVEPVFTVGTGVILGGLLLAMYLPIVNVVNTIR